MAITVRNTQARDFDGIIDLSRRVYQGSPPWNVQQLSSHLSVFPEGQFVAVETPQDRVVGMAASLIVLWDDYDLRMTWRDFTDSGMFTNHDPECGRTLYGAEVMVDPAMQRRVATTLGKTPARRRPLSFLTTLDTGRPTT